MLEFQIDGKWCKPEEVPIPVKAVKDRRKENRRKGERRRNGERRKDH